jgi:hypothetical protein
MRSISYPALSILLSATTRRPRLKASGDKSRWKAFRDPAGERKRHARYTSRTTLGLIIRRSAPSPVLRLVSRKLLFVSRSLQKACNTVHIEVSFGHINSQRDESILIDTKVPTVEGCRTHEWPELPFVCSRR